jgi:polysaccharide export outer membrane protein
MMKTIALGILLTLLCLFTGQSVFATDNYYRVGPDDVLEISVWRDDSLSREIVVPPDGIISFPLIGDIDVNNMTVADLRNRVTKKLAEFIPDATVTVILKQIKSLKAYVIGKVKNPGEFGISMDTTVMQVLSMAGGLNPYAAEDKIHILRQMKDKTIRIPFNYDDVVKGRNLEQNIILKRGDVVVVP